MTCFTEGELCPNRPVPNTHIVIVSVFGAGHQSKVYASIDVSSAQNADSPSSQSVLCLL